MNKLYSTVFVIVFIGLLFWITKKYRENKVKVLDTLDEFSESRSGIGADNGGVCSYLLKGGGM